MIDRICPYFKDFDEYEGKCQIVDDCCEVEKARYYFKGCWRYDNPNVAKALLEIGRSLARVSLIKEKIRSRKKSKKVFEDKDLEKLRQLYKALNNAEKQLGTEIIKEIKHRLAEGYLKRDEMEKSLFLTKDEYEAVLSIPISDFQKK
jgi:hypothetical protein